MSIFFCMNFKKAIPRLAVSLSYAGNVHARRQNRCVLHPPQSLKRRAPFQRWKTIHEFWWPVKWLPFIFPGFAVILSFIIRVQRSCLWLELNGFRHQLAQRSWMDLLVVVLLLLLLLLMLMLLLVLERRVTWRQRWARHPQLLAIWPSACLHGPAYVYAQACASCIEHDILSVMCDAMLAWLSRWAAWQETMLQIGSWWRWLCTLVNFLHQ